MKELIKEFAGCIAIVSMLAFVFALAIVAAGIADTTSIDNSIAEIVYPISK